MQIDLTIFNAFLNVLMVAEWNTRAYNGEELDIKKEQQLIDIMFMHISIAFCERWRGKLRK